MTVDIPIPSPIEMAIMEKLQDRLLTEERKFLNENKRDMGIEEQTIALNRLCREMIIESSSNTVTLLQKDDEEVPVKLSELYRIYKNTDRFNGNLVICLNKSPDFYKALTHLEECHHYLDDEYAEIYLDDFIEFLMASMPFN